LTWEASATAGAGPRQRAVDLHPHPRRGDGARHTDKVRGHGCGRSADRSIREVPRPCTGRFLVLPRASVARGLRGRDLAGRSGQVGRHPGGVPRLRPGAGRRHDPRPRSRQPKPTPA
jgi:hypothetical protein